MAGPPDVGSLTPGDGPYYPHAVKKEDVASRIWEIDFLRGLSIILMVGYHLLFDLGEFAGVKRFLGFSTDLSSAAWTVGPVFLRRALRRPVGDQQHAEPEQRPPGPEAPGRIARRHRGHLRLRSVLGRLFRHPPVPGGLDARSTARRSRKPGRPLAPRGARSSSGSARVPPDPERALAVRSDWLLPFGIHSPVVLFVRLFSPHPLVRGLPRWERRWASPSTPPSGASCPWRLPRDVRQLRRPSFPLDLPRPPARDHGHPLPPAPGPLRTPPGPFGRPCHQRRSPFRGFVTAAFPAMMTSVPSAMSS